MQERLAELKIELDAGRVEFDRLERERASLRDTLLRIGGAIQVLEELLGKCLPEPVGAEVTEQVVRAG
jgi:hypothetical protein